MRLLAAAFSALFFAGAPVLAAPASSPALPPPDNCIPADIPVEQGFVTSSDGTRLYYRKLGRARPVAIYVHGGPGGTIYNGGCEMAELAREYPLVLYDQRGGGRSDLVSDAARLTWRHHVDDLNAVLEHVGGKRVTLIGFSWGAGLATLYADSHPQRVSRLLLIAPMPVAKLPFARERGDAIRKAAGPARMTLRSELETKQQAAKSDEEVVRLCRQILTEAPLPYTVDAAKPPRSPNGCDFPASVIKNRGFVFRGTMTSMGDWDYRPMLARFREPVLVIEGKQTKVPLSSTTEWARAAPEGRLLLFESAGHDVPLDQPRALLTAAREFLRGGNPQGAVRPSP